MTKAPGVVDRGTKVEIWSDVACPWCHIGKRFEAAPARLDHGVTTWLASKEAPRTVTRDRPPAKRRLSPLTCPD